MEDACIVVEIYFDLYIKLEWNSSVHTYLAIILAKPKIINISRKRCYISFKTLNLKNWSFKKDYATKIFTFNKVSVCVKHISERTSWS